ncbi:MAG: 3-mercaptopyruvate sulfurtransferase [Proteobacteria bacterium]|nr:3-mercaptopyruvate sulfurtransferase [Pseudomonadota bacterium]
MADRSRWLVSTEWLAAHLADSNLVILDGSWHLPASGRHGSAEYETAHIPGALFFDIDAVADTGDPLPHMLPTPEHFAAMVGAMGIGDGDRIVVYDSLGLFSAPRVWWTFKVMGARDVVILDGGLPKWQAEGRPVESGPARQRPARVFHPRFDPDAVRNLAAVRANLDTGAFQLVDARPAARFRGEAPEPRAGLRSGHMPGALNLPWSGLINPDGTMKSGGELRAAFLAADVDLDGPIVTSCGSGVSAALLALALARLGREDVAVYDGSWTEWGGRADTPIATGA